MGTSVDKTARKHPIDPFMDWGFKYLFGREDQACLCHLPDEFYLREKPDTPKGFHAS